MIAVEVPPEPADRSVVLDRDAQAWQRNGHTWWRADWQCESDPYAWAKTWPHLVVDRGPLARLITEAEAVEYAQDTDDGWRRATYTGPGCETFVGNWQDRLDEQAPGGWARAGFDAPDCELFAGNLDDVEPCVMTAP